MLVLRSCLRSLDDLRRDLRHKPMFGEVDWVYSPRDLLLRDGHSYHVRLNDDPAYPQVLKLLRERVT